MTVLDIIATLIGLLGGGGGLAAVITMRSTTRKAAAEAKSSELDNMQKAIDSWREIANERQEANAEFESVISELNKKIDELYAVNSEWRDKYNAKCEEITQLKVWQATNEIKLCLRRCCQEREPQSGY